MTKDRSEVKVMSTNGGSYPSILSNVKAMLNIFDTSYDDKINYLIASSFIEVENFVEQSFFAKRFRVTFGVVEESVILTMGPNIDIVFVKDLSGADIPYTATKLNETLYFDAPNGAQIEYNGGYNTTTSLVPAPIISAVVDLVCSKFDKPISEVETDWKNIKRRLSKYKQVYV